MATNGMKLVLLLAELVTLASAVVVALHPNILYGAIALLFTFLGVAVMFVYAGADFLAGAQVVVYVGGVTILILFAIMLTQWLYQLKLRDVGTKMLVPIAIGVAIFALLYKGLRVMSEQAAAIPVETVAKFNDLPKTGLIGQALLGSWLLPFEAITILLLGALVGAVWLARPK
jgi:NAD(P)H-quinone oxidoreductase subunit 6